MSVSLIIFLLSAASLGSIAIGFVSYTRSRNNVGNVFFSLLAISTGLWGGISIFRFFVNQSLHTDSLYLTKLAVVSVATAFFALLLFAYSFPSGKFSMPKRLFWSAFILYIANVILTFMPGVIVISESYPQVQGIQAFQPETVWGPFYAYLFAPFLFLCCVVGVWRLVAAYRGEAKEFEKKQVFYVLLGLSIGGGTGLVIWFFAPFIPVLAGYYWLARFSLFIFVGFSGYAVWRFGLFSIKTAAAEVFTFIILVFLFAQVISSIGAWKDFILNGSLFIFVAFFGGLLIQSVRREVEQRERLELLSKKMIYANRRLEEFDSIKSQFLSFASHQVKTPMTIIKGYVCVLQEEIDTLSPQEIRSVAGKIRLATDRTILLVNNLLDLRRIEEGRMIYAIDAANIVPVMKDVADELRLMAETKGISFSFEPGDDTLVARADVQKLRQAFLNVVENSVKYTAKGGVTITMERREDNIIISVADTGVGIPHESLQKLFQEFRRDSAEVESIKGTGLGLYVVRHIVAAHKGRVWAESEGEGKGSIFRISIPAAEESLKV